MPTSQEIRTVTFDKAVRGYRCDDVDDFLNQTAQEMARMEADKEDTQQKLLVLAQKIEEYRAEEDSLKSALLNAQRMGENIIREAKQKAERILREANIKADDMETHARDQVQEQADKLERMKAEVTEFRTNVLSLYKKHIQLLGDLPCEEEELPAAPLEADAQPEPLPAEEPQTVQPEALEEEAQPQSAEETDPIEVVLAAAQSAPVAQPNELDLSALFDLSDSSAAAGQQDAVSAQPGAFPPGFDAFQGIKFDD